LGSLSASQTFSAAIEEGTGRERSDREGKGKRRERQRKRGKGKKERGSIKGDFQLPSEGDRHLSV